MNPQTVLITGATGNMGRKLRGHLTGRCQLRLIDSNPRGDSTVLPADLSIWGDWHKQFQGVDVVFHFAADPEAYKPWSDLIGPNVDALINVYQAAALAGVKRVVFASSNHVMGGYQDDVAVSLKDSTPPQPGLRYRVDGLSRSSVAYASAKLFGERLGKCYAETHGLESIAVRLGWIWRGGENVPENLPSERGEWFRLMWLSDRDYLHLMDRCLLADLAQKFVIVNGMSNNMGMPWDLEVGRRLLGFHPQDDITPFTAPWPASSAGTWPLGNDYRILDLTLPFREGMRGYTWETTYTIEQDGWNARTLHLYSHAGTHMDAQVHFAAGPESIDQIPLDRCSGWARVVPLPGTTPKEVITVQHLGSVAHTFRPGEVLLLATGWSQHSDHSNLYRDELPRIGMDLARWCVDHQVKLLGVEPPSVANVQNRQELTAIHQTLLAGKVGIVEGLTNLDQLQPQGEWFLATPLKIEGSDGSPCRALAIGKQGAKN